MAWIRRVRTASGATAVQIAESVQGRRRIVKHVGSAHSEADLWVLVAQAEALLADPGLGELDLGLEPTPRKVELAPETAMEPKLVEDAEPDEGARVSTPRVMSTSSRLLFEVLMSVYEDLGFDRVDDATFRDLVIARVVEPTSILDAGRVLMDLGQVPASDKTLRRSLARAQERRYRDQVASSCFTRAASSWGCHPLPV